jgi:hypothetical protein
MPLPLPLTDDDDDDVDDVVAVDRKRVPLIRLIVDITRKVERVSEDDSMELIWQM